jgi:hypothetical protein
MYGTPYTHTIYIRTGGLGQTNSYRSPRRVPGVRRLGRWIRRGASWSRVRRRRAGGCGGPRRSRAPCWRPSERGRGGGRPRGRRRRVGGPCCASPGPRRRRAPASGEAYRVGGRRGARARRPPRVGGGRRAAARGGASDPGRAEGGGAGTLQG